MADTSNDGGMIMRRLLEVLEKDRLRGREPLVFEVGASEYCALLNYFQVEPAPNQYLRLVGIPVRCKDGIA